MCLQRMKIVIKEVLKRYFEDELSVLNVNGPPWHGELLPTICL